MHEALVLYARYRSRLGLAACGLRAADKERYERVAKNRNMT